MSDYLISNKEIAIGIGKRLRELRKYRELSCTELAKMLGVSSSLITHYERGISSMPSATIYKLQHLLNIDIRFFYNFERSLSAVDMDIEAEVLRNAFYSIKNKPTRSALTILARALSLNNVPTRKFRRKEDSEKKHSP